MFDERRSPYWSHHIPQTSWYRSNPLHLALHILIQWSLGACFTNHISSFLTSQTPRWRLWWYSCGATSFWRRTRNALGLGCRLRWRSGRQTRQHQLEPSHRWLWLHLIQWSCMRHRWRLLLGLQGRTPYCQSKDLNLFSLHLQQWQAKVRIFT